MKKAGLFFAIFLAGFPLYASEPIEVHHDWGKLGTVYQYGRYYVAAAPDEAALQQFKNEKGGLVVDLRSVQELDCSSRTSAKKAGIKYQSCPLDVDRGFQSKPVAAAEKILDDAPADQPILLACKTGNRAAAILALHLATTEHLTAEQTLSRAESLGMTSTELRKKLKKYLASASSPTSTRQ